MFSNCKRGPKTDEPTVVAIETSMERAGYRNAVRWRWERPVERCQRRRHWLEREKMDAMIRADGRGGDISLPEPTEVGHLCIVEEDSWDYSQQLWGVSVISLPKPDVK